MISCKDGVFELHTEHTTYLFRVMENGMLEHLYYGARLRVADAAPFALKHPFLAGNTIQYSPDFPGLTLENMMLEMSSYGKGDIREPFVELVFEDGSFTSDFVFTSYEISREKEEFDTLPGSYSDRTGDETDETEQKGGVWQLKICLKEKQENIRLFLYYWVFPECDVISRSARLLNESGKTVILKRLMSLQLDFMTSDYVFTTFTGAWAREMRRNDIAVQAGRYVNASYAGTTSSRANSFVMLAREHTTEDAGECFGFHLIYSGNHYEAVEVGSFGGLRLVTGINPQSFCIKLTDGEQFEAPEAVMSYAKNGRNELSQRLHEFVREHIVRGEWKKKERPVLLNSWEAAYFDINERKLSGLAKAAKEIGIELFVMDDGWFSGRDDDTSSLGDWSADEKKLPNGIAGICNKVKALGLDFGIWVEPEMVNVKSRLYETHPDWVLEHPLRDHSEGRSQRILDLTNTKVQDYIIGEMTKVFSSADISYVKWDMNRIFSDVYSVSLPADRQGEVFHRYVCGLYRCMKELTARFPHILFEGCSAGGNRFDLGILCYFPQIWASDNTDALCRAEIQNNYSYGYPLSVISAHVSGCPNHQTLRNTPLETRFHVAAFGLCGYECNLTDLKKEQMDAIREQITLYKKYRSVLQFGDFYRGRNYAGEEKEYSSAIALNGSNTMEWTCVSKDKRIAVGMLFQKLMVPNNPFAYYRAKGLDADAMYHFTNRSLKYSVKDFGDLVNTVSPIHIKPDSAMQNLVARFVKMDGENEDYRMYGDALMNHGVKLKAAFAATGYSDEVRFYPDFASRIYFMEKEDGQAQSH